MVKSDPDYSVGVLIGFSEQRKRWVIAHVERFRCNPGEVKARVRGVAERDAAWLGSHRIILPQDPGQAGVDQKASYSALLAGYSFEIRPVTGEKVVRASPFASQVEMRNVEVYRDPATGARNDWQDALLGELAAFPSAAHDDQVDAVASGFNALTGGTQGLLEYFKNKLAARAEEDAAKAAAGADKHVVAPDHVFEITKEETTNLARAFISTRGRPPT